MRWKLSCGGIGLEDWAANMTLRATSRPRQVRLAGGRRDSGRVRLRGGDVADKACCAKSCKGRCRQQSTAWLAGRFRMLNWLRGSQQLWRGEPVGGRVLNEACQEGQRAFGGAVVQGPLAATTAARVS